MSGILDSSISASRLPALGAIQGSGAGTEAYQGGSSGAAPYDPMRQYQGSPGPGMAYGGVDYPTALGLYGAQAAPQQGLLDQQDALTRARQAAIQGTYGVNQQGLNTNYDIGMGRIGINQQQDQAAMRGTQAQLDYWNRMIGVAGGRYGTDTDYYKALGSLAQSYYGTQSGLIGQARGLRGQESGISLADALRAYEHNTFQFGSGQVGKGAWNTQGTGEGFGNLGSQYDLQQQLIRNQLAQANVGFDAQQAAAQNNMQKEVLGSTKGQGDAYADYQTELARASRGTGEAQSQMDQLKLKGQEYGLDQRQLANQLQQGLANLNLDQVLKISDIMGSLASNDYQRQQVANQIIAQAMQASGYMPGTSSSTPGPTPTQVNASTGEAGGGGLRFE